MSEYEKWEVAFLAKGGRLSDHEKLIVKDFVSWLKFEAAKQTKHPTLPCGYCHDVDNAVKVDPKCPEHGWQSR